jgi:hypothetical protein
VFPAHPPPSGSGAHKSTSSAGVQIAAVVVVGEEGVKLSQQVHRREPTARRRRARGRPGRGLGNFLIGSGFVDLVVCRMTLTVTRSVLRIHGLTPGDLQQPELTPENVRALKLLLEAYGFDLVRPIRVSQVPGGKGVRLTQ